MKESRITKKQAELFAVYHAIAIATLLLIFGLLSDLLIEYLFGHSGIFSWAMVWSSTFIFSYTLTKQANG